MDSILNRTYKTTEEIKYSVICVDDEEVNLRIFRRAFDRHYNVFTANNGYDAIDILKNNHIDLIMTDQRMPNMTGTELLLKVVPKYPNIVRMIMTGFSDEGEIARVDDKIGLDRYLVKPWNKEELKEEFDRALELRKMRDPSDNLPADYAPDNNLDLVESTLSLVESVEGQELKAEINNLVNENKAKKRPEFFNEDINELLSLKESLMPVQNEIKIHLDDSFIVFDHRSVNKNGYWFGEIEDHVIIASFYANAETVPALIMNTFVSATLTEIVYKERVVNPDKIIDELSKRLLVRLFDKDENKAKSIDIALVAISKEEEKIFQTGAHHHLYCFDRTGEFKVLGSAKDPLFPGRTVAYSAKELDLDVLKELYFIPHNILEETQEVNNRLEALKNFLDEIHRYPMNMQAKLFDEYHYKNIIGLRF